MKPQGINENFNAFHLLGGWYTAKETFFYHKTMTEFNQKHTSVIVS